MTAPISKLSSPLLFENPFPFSLYRVGGAVRDHLMGYPYEDVDWVVVGATPEGLMAQGFQAVGKDFPVFLHPTTKEEYALARTERKSGKGYTGFVCYSSPDVTLEDDLRRRDLTINAMAQSTDGKVIDPYGGQTDLTNKVLRHVSDAFEEDPVRMLRIARFAARYHHLGFTIAPDTQHLLKKMVLSGEAKHLVAERVWKECERAHDEKSPAVFWQTLFECGVLKELAPFLHEQLTASQAFPQLQDLFHQMTEKNSRFSGLLLWAYLFTPKQSLLDSLSLQHLLPKLPVPKHLQSNAQYTLSLWQWLVEPSTANSETLLALFTQCGAFKKVDTWQSIVSLCRVFFELSDRWMKNRQDYPSAQIKQRLSLLAPALEKVQSIQPKALMDKGYQGKALGDALKQSRLEAINNIMQVEKI